MVRRLFALGFLTFGLLAAQETGEDYYYNPETGLYYDESGEVIQPDYYDPFGQPVYQDLDPGTYSDPYDWTSPAYGDFDPSDGGYYYDDPLGQTWDEIGTEGYEYYDGGGWDYGGDDYGW